MPESRFRSASRRAGAGLVSIKDISAKFDVSLTCAAIRCLSAEVFPSVLIKWSQGGFCWKWCSPSFWQFGYRRTVQAFDALPRQCATLECRDGGAAPDTVFERTITAAYMFPGIYERSFRNIPLREEAISLGRFGYLTLLTLREPFPKEVIAARTRELGFDE